jgi:hypothetical protein
MSLAQRLDELLRERVFQRIADRVRDRSGASCFELAARAAQILPGAHILCIGARLGESGVAWTGALGLGFAVFLAITGNVAAVRAEKAFLARSALPPDTPWAAFNRRLFAAFSIINFVFAVSDAFVTPGDLAADASRFILDLDLVSYFYFMACRPKPTRRQQARVPSHAAMAGASP